jgi:hypothetical protein
VGPIMSLGFYDDLGQQEEEAFKLVERFIKVE